MQFNQEQLEEVSAWIGDRRNSARFREVAAEVTKGSTALECVLALLSAPRALAYAALPVLTGRFVVVLPARPPVRLPPLPARPLTRDDWVIMQLIPPARRGRRGPDPALNPEWQRLRVGMSLRGAMKLGVTRRKLRHWRDMGCIVVALPRPLAGETLILEEMRRTGND